MPLPELVPYAYPNPANRGFSGVDVVGCVATGGLDKNVKAEEVV